MALFAFDGTWNEEKTSEDLDHNTNVVRFHDAYHRHSGTNDLYAAGVGTRYDLLGGVFGLGELWRLDQAYAHLCRCWDQGDRVIDVVGFSRGAATTLDFCHIIMERGIRRPGTEDVVEPSPTVRFLGVWDVVAAFGLVNLGNVALNIGHHLMIPRANLQYAFHALALDERRVSFLPIRLEGAYEVWFRGVHSDIGGGNGNRGLNDITLKWMMRKAMAAGLPIQSADLTDLDPRPQTRPAFPPVPLVPVRVVSAVDQRHYTVSAEEGCTNPPDTCRIETDADEQQAKSLASLELRVLAPELQDRVNSL